MSIHIACGQYRQTRSRLGKSEDGTLRSVGEENALGTSLGVEGDTVFSGIANSSDAASVRSVIASSNAESSPLSSSSSFNFRSRLLHLFQFVLHLCIAKVEAHLQVALHGKAVCAEFLMAIDGQFIAKDFLGNSKCDGCRLRRSMAADADAVLSENDLSEWTAVEQHALFRQGKDGGFARHEILEIALARPQVIAYICVAIFSISVQLIDMLRRRYFHPVRFLIRLDSQMIACHEPCTASPPPISAFLARETPKCTSNPSFSLYGSMRIIQFLVTVLSLDTISCTLIK